MTTTHNLTDGDIKKIIAEKFNVEAEDVELKSSTIETGSEMHPVKKTVITAAVTEKDRSFMI